MNLNVGQEHMIWPVIHGYNPDSLVIQRDDAVMLRLPLLLEELSLNGRIPDTELSGHDIPVALLVQLLGKRPVGLSRFSQGVSHGGV